VTTSPSTGWSNACARAFFDQHGGSVVTYHFLEVNPAGEWGWLERDLDLPIADAIARALVDGANE
jgi:hypothetical protein